MVDRHRLFFKHAATRRPRPIPPSPSKNSRHSFDSSSGLMYTETSAPIQSGDDQDWIYRADISSQQKQGNPIMETRKGTRSLQDIAIDCIVQHISEVTLNGLKYLPTQALQKIWDILHREGLVSLHTFSVFSKLLFGGNSTRLDLLRYSAQIQTVRSPLHIYARALTSKSFEFLTTLSLTASFPVPELVKLSSVINIVALEIVSTNSQPSISIGVSDRLLRAWHLAAQDEGAFPVLRILRLWNHQDVTAKSLEYIDSFPALAIFDVKGCNVAVSAKNHNKLANWKPNLDFNILGLLETACVERVMLMQSKLGLEPRPIRRLSAQPLPGCIEVVWIPRSKVPEFLTRPENTASKKSFDKSGPEDYPRNQTNCLQRIKKQLFYSPEESLPWEFQTYTSLAKIGELRNDVDLRKAGVEIGDQALVDSELINSVPIVSLRLGPGHSRLESSFTDGISKPLHLPIGTEHKGFVDHSHLLPGDDSLAFIRIGLSKIKVGGGECPSSSRALKESREPIGGQLGTKRPSSTISDKKRRKLDDVLSSFQ